MAVNPPSTRARCGLRVFNPVFVSCYESVCCHRLKRINVYGLSARPTVGAPWLMGGGSGDVEWTGTSSEQETTVSTLPW